MVVLLTLLLCWRLAAAFGHLLQRYAPTNIAIRFLRSPRGLKWAIPVALLVTPAYLLAAYACTTMLKSGGPGCLHIFVVLLIWNAMKFAWLGVLGPLMRGRDRVTSGLARSA